MSKKTKENIETQENIQVETENTKFNLSDKQVNILRQHANALNSYYAGIGAQYCELMDNVKQVESIRSSISQLQEDIAKELNLPRADRISWNLDSKTVEIIK